MAAVSRLLLAVKGSGSSFVGEVFLEGGRSVPIAGGGGGF